MRFGAAALTLAFGLTVVGMASAQESSSWLPRWLAPAEKADADRVADKSDAPKVTPAVNRSALKAAKKATADWERRTEVCLKLRGIALETGDDDLLRKVEQLEQRAGELYIASKKSQAEPESSVPAPDAKKGARK
jgi:hypothetical protein